MSGYYNEMKEFSPETWDTLKSGSRQATLAGHNQAISKEVHVLALDLVHSFPGMTYEDAERRIVSMIGGPSLDKKNEANKMQAAMRAADGEGMGKYTHRSHKVNKSSKGKYPSNRTPPKKKRK